MAGNSVVWVTRFVFGSPQMTAGAPCTPRLRTVQRLVSLAAHAVVSSFPAWYPLSRVETANPQSHARQAKLLLM